MARRPRDIRSRILRAVIVSQKKPRKRSLSVKVKAARKSLRHAVAILKRKGLLPSWISGRKNVTSKAVKAAVKRNADIIAGMRTAWKLPDDIPKKIIDDLKSMGYRVEGRGKNKRLVLPKSQFVKITKDKTKPVKIMARGSRSRDTAEIINIKLQYPTIDQQITEAFAGLKQGDFMGFSVDGGASYSIYDNASSLYNWLSQYEIFKDQKINHLTVFRVIDIPEYIANGQRRMDERKFKRLEFRRQRARERRAAKGGMRVTRGH